MTEDRYIAALEISSSKIIGAVGKATGSGHLDVIAIESEKSVDEVRWGIIQNLEDTSLRIDRIIKKLERKPEIAPKKITGVFVGISGRSMKSVTTEVVVNLPEDSEITEAVLDNLKNQAQQTPVNSTLKIIDAIPRTYYVDGQEIPSPKGTVGHNIKGVFDLIVCRPELFKNMSRTVEDKCGNHIVGEIITPLACGHLILTSDEKRLGCMLVDIGSETTVVTIYTHGQLKYYATIPLGGRNITRDLTSLSLLEERAEDIKRVSGNALGSKTTSINIHGVRYSDVSNLIVARAEEIVANIVEQLNYAGIKENTLRGGIVVIGGGSLLNGMIELLERKSGLPVRRGKFPPYIDMKGNRIPEQEAAGIVSILYTAATKSKENCLDVPETEPIPAIGNPNEPDVTDDPIEEPVIKTVKKRRWGEKIKNALTSFITPSDSDDDDSELL